MSVKLAITKMIPDKVYLNLMFLKHFHRLINFRNPKTFNEKLQWLKLYDRNPLYTKLVAKLEVKKYVAETIGEEYVSPTLGVWEKPEDIDFDSLPDQFVLKWNHDSGSVVICKDKSKFNKEEAIAKLQHGKKYNGFWYGREWPYKNVKPYVFAEKYMEDSQTKELRDYKFFCFNGNVKLLFVATDRYTLDCETKFDFFDADFAHLALLNGHPNAEITPVKPKSFDLMKALAASLSASIPHLRVDFYEVDGKVYFGEFTFFHYSGFVPFEPKSWDDTLGEWLELPKK